MNTHQSDASSSYYQYYKSHFQNTNYTISNSIDSIFASAPPLSSPSDHPYTFPHLIPHPLDLAHNSISYPPNPSHSSSSSTLFSPCTRGSSSSASGEVLFDDYGRPLWKQSESNKIVKAVPKEESSQDNGSGVLKFRVLLLSEGSGQSDMDVLCQIGLDGIRLLDLADYRSLRIYPIDTVTKWEVLDSYIFVFGAKTSIDSDLKRIRLKSNSYTTNNILDAVTAACIQFKEIGSSYVSSDASRISDQPSERKKGIVDWINTIKPKMEEKYHWIPDEAVNKCNSCGANFGPFFRRHHCRNCGDIFCDKCTQGRISLTTDEDAQSVRVCDRCMAEVTQRLVNSKEKSIVSVAPLQSHDDLVKKLKEEMEKNKRTTSSSTGLKSKGSGNGNQMKEVACPTCTVHLQVQVPSSGSETVECSVCQHPFSVNSYY
ncbi:protein FREE1-like [Impatiens glandulifera]|uniref:protein FREE1-like n=1 Tax=Impatiens glandulifera TaxID=253017 RepID=UPI001FB1172D|nr:protein FREE1-like [Impatiens glandulifera]